jgi:pilin/secretion family protein with methylation motif
MTQARTPSRRGAGVTLIEMMVALAITTFVILVVNKLFNEVITTVGRGTQAGEILQRSRALDEQLATETELQLSGGKDPSEAGDWWGRMVGPAGRDSTEPGGFLVVVQRRIPTPLTIEDAIVGNTRLVRSDQLMFIYDQTPNFDQTGKKRLPPLAPAGDGTYGGDMRNSLNADYVRMWYGHAAQLDETGTYIDDLGAYAVAGNPNAIAQDWVLGRHALFLTDSSGNPGVRPYGAHTGNAQWANITANVINGPSAKSMYHGMTDVADITLDNMVNAPVVGLDAVANIMGYQGRMLSMMFASRPMQTTAKPVTSATGILGTWDTAPAHTYFMGGVSDFIVEFAGDLVRGVSYNPTVADVTAGPDGELDRDLDGRIKWYTFSIFQNPSQASGVLAFPNDPVTYRVPDPADYPPNVPQATVNAFIGARLDAGRAAFVWQHDGSPGFEKWPWMLRVRYRLHDRRGQFEGRQITVGGVSVPEPGAWFETIIPVNHQGQ